MDTANNLTNDLDIQQQLNNQLLKAAQLGDAPVLEALIAKGANINAIDSLNGRTPLINAALNGHIAVVSTLLALPGIVINAVSRSGNSALMAACISGHIAVVRAMLFAPQLDVHIANEERNTAIVLALEEGHQTIVRLLQDNGAVLPQHLTNDPLNYIEDNINTAQSVHETSVHLSVSNSAKNLVAHYQYDAKQIATAIDSLIFWLDNTFVDSDTLSKEYKPEWLEPAKRGVARLCKLNFIDQRSNVSLQEALALVWVGINNPNANGENRPLLDKQELTDRSITFLKHLYEIQRAYNLSSGANPKDNGETDRPTCSSGSFNKLIAALSEVGHLGVQVVFVTPTLINEQVPILTKQAFHYLSGEQKEKFSEGWKGENAEVIQAECFDLLQNWVQHKLHEKYDDFDKEVPNLNQVITEAMNHVEYTELDEVITQERAILESKKKEKLLNTPAVVEPLIFLCRTRNPSREKKFVLSQEVFPTFFLDSHGLRRSCRLKN